MLDVMLMVPDLNRPAPVLADLEIYLYSAP
jgi:hypothetical protein